MTIQSPTSTSIHSQINLLETWIESLLAYKGLPGLSIAVVHDQELVWSRGFGFADLHTRRPAGPETLYRIASISKLFTATAIMTLRDAGQLQLDDPVRRHLPWFQVKSQFSEAPEITLRHLLTHTSGLPRESAFPYWEDDVFPTHDQLVAALPGQEAALPTETKWKYSNLALALAGEVVAAVSGQPWTEFIQQRIFQPLGMHNSYAASVDPQHPHLALGYGRRMPDLTPRQLSPYTDSRAIAPAANIATSVEDLARFAMLQFRTAPAGGSQILKGSTLREMQRPHWVDPAWDAGWGIGFRILRVNGKTYIGHGGSVKGYRTHLHISLPDKVAVIVFCNADDAAPRDYAQKAMDWLVPVLNPAAGKSDLPVPAGWNRFTGHYRNPWGDAEVLVLDGKLLMIDPTQPDPLLEADRLIPVSDNVFRVEAGSGYSDEGELVVFELDESGKVTSVVSSGGRTFPIPAW